jgi:hypothetical protein
MLLSFLKEGKDTTGDSIKGYNVSEIQLTLADPE